MTGKGLLGTELGSKASWGYIEFEDGSGDPASHKPDVR